MNRSLTFEDLSAANQNRCVRVFHPINEWTPTDWATALAGETGELCNFIKKLRRLDDGPHKPYNAGVDPHKLRAEAGKELADIVIYADLLATRLKLDLGDEVRKKFNEISNRVGSDIKL